MTESFYLKYRPQNFQDLDSSEAREELKKIFESGRFPHAFLFSGPRGIGKTSAARIVAKAVNCTGKKETDFEPCNKCSSCISITNGSNMDVFEIDAASNRGIDDIKELRDKIKLTPSSSKYKVYIIDEVHMLTTEAFNALLKTLEEPPKHALFILCTTDPQKLPKTITSRCSIVNFKKASQKELLEKLERICKEEKAEYEEKALLTIAKMADGSFRDANKILERVVLSGKVTEDEVKKIAGVMADFPAEQFLKLLSEKNTKEALLWISRAVEGGVNLRLLTETLMADLRGMLLSNFGVEEIEPEIKTNLSLVEIQLLIGLFSRAYFDLKYAVIPQLPLEMAIIEWGERQKVEGGGEKLEKKTKSENTVIADEKKEEIVARTVNPSSCSIETVHAKWSEILEKVKPLNHSVQAFLKACRPRAMDGDFLILEVFYKFHKDQLETEKCRQIFEKVASEVLGEKIKLKCSLSEVERPVKPMPVIENITTMPPADYVKPKTAKVAGSGDDDIIKFAEEIFNKGGTIQ